MELPIITSDVLVLIFWKLSNTNKAKCRLVCKYWNSIVSDNDTPGWWDVHLLSPVTIMQSHPMALQWINQRTQMMSKMCDDLSFCVCTSSIKWLLDNGKKFLTRENYFAIATRCSVNGVGDFGDFCQAFSLMNPLPTIGEMLDARWAGDINNNATMSMHRKPNALKIFNFLVQHYGFGWWYSPYQRQERKQLAILLSINMAIISEDIDYLELHREYIVSDEIKVGVFEIWVKTSLRYGVIESAKWLCHLKPSIFRRCDVFVNISESDSASLFAIKLNDIEDVNMKRRFYKKAFYEICSMTDLDTVITFSQTLGSLNINACKLKDQRRKLKYVPFCASVCRWLVEYHNIYDMENAKSFAINMALVGVNPFEFAPTDQFPYAHFALLDMDFKFGSAFNEACLFLSRAEPEVIEHIWNSQICTKNKTQSCDVMGKVVVNLDSFAHLTRAQSLAKFKFLFPNPKCSVHSWINMVENNKSHDISLLKHIYEYNIIDWGETKMYLADIGDVELVFKYVTKELSNGNAENMEFLSQIFPNYFGTSRMCEQVLSLVEEVSCKLSYWVEHRYGKREELM